jgi:TonB family protein
MKTISFSINLLIIIGMLGLTCFSQASEERGIWRATPLTYPAIARVAQIQGDVRLDIEVDRTGQIISVSKIDGPDSLATAAAKEIKEWRYTSSAQSWHVNLVIHYSLVRPPLPSAPVARVAISTPFDVSVTSNYPVPTGNPETMLPKK